MTNHPLFEMHNISKSFGNEHILKDITLALYPGKITAIIGDNGAGKSTLIKIITGLIKQNQGELIWNNKILAYPRFNATAYARELGIETVYQHLSLIDNLSVLRNFFLGKELIRGLFPFRYLDIKRMTKIVEQQLEKFSLGKRTILHTPVAKLSGGQRQAVAIFRALYFNAKLLILDEPTSALSSDQAAFVSRLIRSATQTNVSILLISHDPEQVKLLADNIIYLKHGHIINIENNVPIS